MCVRYLGLVLLAWLPGLLQAQMHCSPPQLTRGYFVPQQGKYNHGQTLTYSCDTGFKPVVEGWWAKSTCQNGDWTHTPNCTDISSCLPLAFENGKYENAQRGFYNNQETTKIICDDGFDTKLRSGSIQCSNGTWFPLPVCERNINACDKPGEIPHAVIINQELKEVYSHNSRLEYQCENGYTAGQANYGGAITCQDGSWTEPQSCIPAVRRCVLDLSRVDDGQTLQISIEDGETKWIQCRQREDKWMLVTCSNGKIEATQCCYRDEIQQNACRFTKAR